MSFSAFDTTALDRLAGTLDGWLARLGNALFGVDTYRRLCEIKVAYDPADLIRANHPVPPAR